jgi:hypothetical protein
MVCPAVLQKKSSLDLLIHFHRGEDAVANWQVTEFSTSGTRRKRKEEAMDEPY